jgi:arginase
VFPQWQGAGPLPRLRESALALAEAFPSNRRRVEVPVEPAHPLSREQGIEGRGEVLVQLAAARRLLDANRPARVFALGGDCSIEVGVVSYLNALYAASLAVIWLDAHPDLNTPESSPSGHLHGMPLRVLLGEGDPGFTALVERRLRPDQVLLAGVRAPDPQERELIGARRIRSLSTESLLEGPEELLRWVRETGCSRAYLHLDLDVCDPREMPMVACPTPGGLPVSMVVELLRTLGSEITIAGVGVTEAMFEGASVPPALQPILDCLAQL